VYVKDSVIEKIIEKDLQMMQLEGRIKEIEYQIEHLEDGNQCSTLQERLEKLRGELKTLLSE
jgi:chaperonin cofactor prefoldin